MAEKLKTDKRNSVAFFRAICYQRCPSSCPRNCSCSSSIPPSLEGLTDHFWRHRQIQMGRKAQVSKTFLFLSTPKYSDEMNEEKSNFTLCVPLDYHGCSSLTLLHPFAMPIPKLFTALKTIEVKRLPSAEQRGLWASSKLLLLPLGNPILSPHCWGRKEKVINSSI